MMAWKWPKTSTTCFPRSHQVLVLNGYMKALSLDPETVRRLWIEVLIKTIENLLFRNHVLAVGNGLLWQALLRLLLPEL